MKWPFNIKRQVEFAGKIIWPWEKNQEYINLQSKKTGQRIEVKIQGPTQKDYEAAMSWGISELDRLDKDASAPKKYESWVPIADGDPFPPKIRITILDYKNGWVRYSMPYFNDERMRLESFLRIYKKETTNDPGR